MLSNDDPVILPQVKNGLILAGAQKLKIWVVIIGELVCLTSFKQWILTWLQRIWASE